MKTHLQNLLIFRKLDAHKKEGIKGFSTAFILKALAAGIGFIVSIIVARLVGAKGVGILSLTSVVIAVSTTIGQLGLGSALVRFIGADASKKDWVKVCGAYSSALKICFFSLSIITALIFFGAAPIAKYLFHKPDLELPIKIMAMSVIPTGIVSLRSEALRGLKLIRQAVNLQQIIPQLISLPFIVIFAYCWQVIGVVSASVIATLIVFAYSTFLWRKYVPQIQNVIGSFEKRMLLKTSIPLLWVGVMHLVMSMADTAILGIWWDAKTVGIYSVALKIGNLLSFLLVAINTIAAPQFAALYGQNNISALEDLAKYFTKLGTFLAIPVLLVIVFGGHYLLQFFGIEFVDGYSALIILAFGQMISVSTGSVGCLLAMTSYEKIVRNITIFCAVLNITLNLLLIPYYNIIGAAIASASSKIVFNLVSLFFVKKKLSITTIPIQL